LSDGIHASSEYLPDGQWHEASAKRAVAEGNLLREIESEPLVTKTLLDGIARARARAMRQGATAEQVAAAQAEVMGWTTASVVLSERISFGALAAKWTPAEVPKQLARPADGMQSSAWRREGEAALRLTEMPGWDILMRRWADMAWSAAWLKTVCPPEAAPVLDAQVRGILGTVQAIEQKIDKLHAAVAWQQEQTAKDRGD
jgi:hypothetical protein